MIKPSVPRSSSGVRTAAIVVAVIALLYLARQILIPLAFAITLTLILTPVVAGLQKLRLGRFPAVLLSMVLTLAIAAGVGWIIFNELVEVVNDLPSYQKNIHNKIQAIRAPSKGAVSRAAASVQELGNELSSVPAPAAPPVSSQNRRGTAAPPVRTVPVAIVAAPANGLEYLRQLVMPILAPLGILCVVLIFSVFLLLEHNDLRNRLFRLAGVDHLNVMTQALDDATKRVSRYLMLQLLVNAGFGILCGLGLFLIGVPYAVLWGAVAAILRIVPYVGALVAGALPLLLSLAVFDHWLRPLLVFLLFATLELVTGNFIEPWLYGMHTGISSLAILLATVFWAALWGPAGLILSTPLTVCVVVLGRHVPHLSFLHILLGDQPVLAAEAQVYQRLLAMDDHEARAVANVYLTENSLVQLYDSVLIPALTMAEQDRHKGALDSSREEFILLSIKEMIAEFPEQSAASPSQEPNPGIAVGRVLCVPASDEADEIAAAMLAQILEQAGCSVLALPLDPSLQHLAAIAEPSKDDVFCISALPPFAFAQARTLSRLLQVRFPRNKQVIGIWGFTGETEKALQSFQPKRPAKLLTSLSGAVEFFAPVAKEDAVEAISI